MKLLIVLTLVILITGCNSNIKENNSEKSEKNIISKKIPYPVPQDTLSGVNSIHLVPLLIKEKEYKENIEINNFKKVDNTIIKTSINNKNIILNKNNINTSNKITKKNILVELKLDKVNYNSNINNLLQFYGKNLELIDFISIGGKKIKGILKTNSYYVGVDKNIFRTGIYNIIIGLKNGKKINSDIKIGFNYNDKNINISNITPNIISNKKDTFIVLQGNGFNKIISVQLNNNVIIKNTSFKVINDNVASIRIDAGLKPGEYFFNIMHTKGINKLSNIKFNITN